SFCARVRENETVGGYVKQTDQLTQLQDGSNVGKTSESITRGGITEGPQPKPLAQKPNREAAVFGWKCKYITIFREDLTTRISTSNLGDQETVFVRPLTTDQPGIRDAASALQFSSMGRRSTHTVTARGGTRAGILPGCPSLDRGSREAERVGFEPRTFRSVNSRSNHTWTISPLGFLGTMTGATRIAVGLAKVERRRESEIPLFAHWINFLWNSKLTATPRSLLHLTTDQDEISSYTPGSQ
ncbi:hypothetical protein CSKR_111578, partial [Clonorchis sinensis]